MGIGSTLSDIWSKLLLGDAFELRLEDMLERMRAERKSLPSQRAGLSDAHRDGKLVLVLGAGVSLDYGVPSWDLLLQELLIRTLAEGKGPDDEQRAALATAYTKAFHPDALMAARYTRLRLKEKFLPAVRELLYARSGADAPDTPLLKEIRNFVIAAGGAPKLDSIITFNFDDILERCIDRIELPIDYQVIADDEIRPKPKHLAIYHVHGFMPRTGELPDKLGITLSEDDYHQRYADVYHWSNIVQINKFRDNTCLFVGLSFSDPNLRRLLDIAQRQRGDREVQHYLVRKRFSVGEAEAALRRLQAADPGATRPPDDAAVQSLAGKLVELMEGIDEADAASFGVSVVWLEDWSRLPAFLKDVYKGKTAKPHAPATR